MSFNSNGSTNGGARKKKRRLSQRRKRALDPNVTIDYKNPDLIKRFVTERGKIIPRRISGASQSQQRQIAAVKRAHLPYPSSANQMLKRVLRTHSSYHTNVYNAANRQRPRFERDASESKRQATEASSDLQQETTSRRRIRYKMSKCVSYRKNNSSWA